jgi:signal transduction histidine kinase
VKNQADISIRQFKDAIQSCHRAEKAERECRRKLSRLSAELAIAAELERRKVASDLHDRIGQNLALLKLKIDDLTIGSEDTDRFIQIRELLSQLIEETRHLVFEISPPVLYKMGLEPALQWLSETMGKDHGLNIQLACDTRPDGLDLQVAIPAFRIVRELLVNAVKHAGASRVDLAITQSDTALSIRIRDNGRGCDAARLRSATAGGTNFGLFNIQRQVSYAGGVFTIESTFGAGFSVELTLPTEKLKHKKSSCTEAVK